MLVIVFFVCWKQVSFHLVQCTCREVELHGQAREHIARNLEPISPLAVCPFMGKHNKSKRRACRRDYNLFAAIEVACLPCVRRALETVDGVAPDVESDTHRWNIRDYANYAVSEDIPGAGDVLHYLETYWSHIACNHA